MLVVVAFDVVDKVLQNDSVVNRKVWGDDEITHCMWVLERKVSKKSQCQDPARATRRSKMQLREKRKRNEKEERRSNNEFPPSTQPI